MTRMETFKPEHALLLRGRMQPGQFDAEDVLHKYEALETMAVWPAWSLFEGDVLLGSGGAICYWPGRWMIWMMLSCDACLRIKTIVRFAKRMLDGDVGHGRLELIVRSDFLPGHRMARILGFEHEAHLQRYMPDSTDGDLYVRFKS